MQLNQPSLCAPGGWWPPISAVLMGQDRPMVVSLAKPSFHVVQEFQEIAIFEGDEHTGVFDSILRPGLA